jgi:nucleotide-binding universal stress UspA family protein
MLLFRTILHPTDFSEPAMYAFGLARAIARASGSELLVVHVAPVRRPRRRRHRREGYEALRRLTTSDPNVRMHPLLLEGDPASQILCSASQQDCDLIVMGTRGRTGLRRLLGGSVSAAVRKDAPCPVVAVQLPAREDWELPDFADLESVVSTRRICLFGAHPDGANGRN